MAKKSMILKQQAEPKFSTRRYNRCKICGRPHAYLRDYGICAGLQGPDPRRQEGVLVNLVPPCCAAAARRTQSTPSPPRLA